MTLAHRRLSAVAACSLGLWVAGASAATSSIVVPGGKVVGLGYAQWLVAGFKYLYGPGATAARPACWTIHGVIVPFAGPGDTVSVTCTVGAGQPVYIFGYANVTFSPGKGPFYQTTAQLKAGAKSDYRAGQAVYGTNVVTLDGSQVDHAKYVRATRVFRLHLPKYNVFGVRSRSVRAVAYGEGLLLQDLSAGTHVVHKIATGPGALRDETVTLNVAG